MLSVSRAAIFDPDLLFIFEDVGFFIFVGGRSRVPVVRLDERLLRVVSCVESAGYQEAMYKANSVQLVES